MRKDETYIRFPLTWMQVIGIVLMAGGLWLLFGSGLHAVRILDKDPHEELAAYSQELEAGVSEEAILGKIRLRQRGEAMRMVPLVFLGGLMAAAAPPLFYASGTRGLLRLRHRRRKEEETQEVDAQYDHPDEYYDYILDPEIREQLIREREAHRKAERRRRDRF